MHFEGDKWNESAISAYFILFPCVISVLYSYFASRIQRFNAMEWWFLHVVCAGWPTRLKSLSEKCCLHAVWYMCFHINPRIIHCWMTSSTAYEQLNFSGALIWWQCDYWSMFFFSNFRESIDVHWTCNIRGGDIRGHKSLMQMICQISWNVRNFMKKICAMNCGQSLRLLLLWEFLGISKSSLSLATLQMIL